MRITYLVENATQIWGGVKSVLEDANVLAARGHSVTVLSKTPPPDWLALRCDYRPVTEFAPHEIPESDLVVGTYFTTVPAATREISHWMDGSSFPRRGRRGRMRSGSRMPLLSIT